MLFLWFMENNGILYSPNGEKRIADNTLVALTCTDCRKPYGRKRYYG